MHNHPLLQRLSLAWRVLLKGNDALRVPNQDFTEIPPITLDEVDEVRRFFQADKYFIFGHARSGTTLLTRLLRLHPQVHCNYQAHFFTRPPLLNALVERTDVRAWLARRSNRWNHGVDLSPLVLRSVADFILERDLHTTGKTIVGDKSPNSLLNGESVRLLQRVYPDVRLIFIVRDGRDAVLSHRFQQFIDVEQHLSAVDIRLRTEFTANPDPFFNGERSIFTEKGLRHAAEGWAKNVNETHQEGQRLYQQRYHALKYEDLLHTPFETIKRVWDFLGADISYPELEERVKTEMQQNPDADWQREKAGQMVSPLGKGKKGSWRSLFTARDKTVFKSIAAQQLIQWGYEQDLDW